MGTERRGRSFTLEPSFAQAANLQRILDRAMAAETAPPGQTVVVEA